MTAFGLDYAWGRISPQAHHAVGSTFAVRYLSDDPSKNLTRAEADGLRHGGVDVVAVWESTADRYLSGRRGGARDAYEATRQAAACGMPEHRPIYFAPADLWTPPQALPAIFDYFRGAAEVRGAGGAGAYLDYFRGHDLLDAHIVDWLWQTYAWSANNLEQRAVLWQFSNSRTVAGVDCDFNKALRDDFGQWGHIQPPPDPYAIFPTSPTFVFHVGGKVVQWDERTLVTHVDGALKEARYRDFLQGVLYPDVKFCRDRIWRIAHFQPPAFTVPRSKPDWTADLRGVRWQKLNDRMKEISRL